MYALQDHWLAMFLNDALNQIIDDGVEAARADYTKPADRLKLDSSIDGFEACRGKTPEQIAALCIEAEDRTARAFCENDPRYWYWRCRTAEIEWVVNVLSNIMFAQGWNPIGPMTTRGAQKAAEIIGIAER